MSATRDPSAPSRGRALPRLWTLGLTLGLVGVLAIGIAGLSAASGRAPVTYADPTTPLDVVVQVDEAACASGMVQCAGGDGHSAVIASDRNHNPLRVVVLVTADGRPVTGIPASSFVYHSGLVPAGGPMSTMCPAGAGGCDPNANFGEIGPAMPGIYQFWVQPLPAGNWKAGTYFNTLTVTDPTGNTSTVLVPFAIANR